MSGKVSEATLRRALQIIDTAGMVKGSLLAWQSGPPTMLLMERKGADKAVIGFINTDAVDSKLRLWEKADGTLRLRYILKGQMPEGCTHRLLVRPPPHLARNRTLAEFRNTLRTFLGGGDLVKVEGVEFWRQTSVDRAISQFPQSRRLVG